MNKRSSPLKARKNTAKPSAKPSAAAQRHVSDLADCEDCSVAEGIPLAAPPTAASAPAPAPATLDPDAQLPAAVNGGILPAAGRECALLSGEAPLGDGSADASIEPPRAPGPAPAAPAPASASALDPVPASAPLPASASAPLPAATKVTPSFYNWSRKLPPMELVQMHYQNGLRAMGEALTVLGDVSRAPKKAPPPSSPPPSPSLSPPIVGRAIIGAIKACSQSSYGAHLAAAALERGLAESELRHSQGMEFLFANLIQPIQDRVGGPVAGAVAKCCLLGVGPQPLYELVSSGNGRGADVDPSSAAAAMSARNKYLVDTLHLDEGDLAAAPELVAGAVLGRLAKLVRSFDADLGPLPLLEQEYLRAYKVARDSATAVIKAADALSKRATSPEAAAAAAGARVLAAPGARKPDADVMPDVLLDDANDEFNRFFEQVDVKLLGKMAESFGVVADASTARVETAYSALQASMDRHHAKELRDAMMLRALRRIAEGGGEGGAPVPVLVAILDAYEAAVEAKLLKSAADLAAAQAGAAAAAAAASAAAVAVAGPATAAPPACTAAVPVAACTNNKNKNSRSDKSTNNKKIKKNKNTPPNCAGCCSCRGGGARTAAAPASPAAPAAPKPPGFVPTEPVAYASNYRLFFAHWPPPLSSPLENIPERLAVTANVWPNDGEAAEGNANAEAAFGHLAVSTVNEREPIRMSHGGASDFDANEGRINEDLPAVGHRVRQFMGPPSPYSAAADHTSYVMLSGLCPATPYGGAPGRGGAVAPDVAVRRVRPRGCTKPRKGGLEAPLNTPRTPAQAAAIAGATSAAVATALASAVDAAVSTAYANAAAVAAAAAAAVSEE